VTKKARENDQGEKALSSAKAWLTREVLHHRVLADNHEVEMGMAS
jgi:hypothetical protein